MTANRSVVQAKATLRRLPVIFSSGDVQGLQ